MATRTIWKELYQDLPEKIATILREVRLKPEQLITKTDGEILAIGLSDADLETIRAKYPSPSVAETAKETKPALTETAPAKTKPLTGQRAKQPRHLYGRSRHYKSLLKKIDKSRSYSITDAVALLQSLSKRPGTVELHLNVIETGLRGEVKLPFSTGKTVKVEIFSDKTITALAENKIEFDVLLASPADMPKLAKYAKILGPKGLMPNPKNGTVTANPEIRAKELAEKNILAYRTEPKFPLIHLTLGQSNQKAEELTANITTLLKEIGLTKITTAYLTATQTPSVRLDLSQI